MVVEEGDQQLEMGMEHDSTDNASLVVFSVSSRIVDTRSGSNSRNVIFIILATSTAEYTPAAVVVETGDIRLTVASTAP